MCLCVGAIKPCRRVNFYLLQGLICCLEKHYWGIVVKIYIKIVRLFDVMTESVYMLCVRAFALYVYGGFLLPCMFNIYFFYVRLVLYSYSPTPISFCLY